MSGAPLEIDTTECEMQLLGEGYKKAGTLTHQLKKIDCDQWNLTTCAFVFENTVRFDPSVITIKGKNALKIVAKNGDIDIRTAIDLSMKGKTIPRSAGTILGGYNNFISGNPGLFCFINITTTCDVPLGLYGQRTIRGPLLPLVPSW